MSLRNIAKTILSKVQTPTLKLPDSSPDHRFPELSITPFSIQDYRYVLGDMPLHEIALLCQIVRFRQPGSIFEIGTFQGGTTLQIAVNAPESCEIHTLDLPLDSSDRPDDPELDVYPDQPGVRFLDTPYSQKITQHLGDSQSFDFSRWYGSIDLVFVDACHHYEFVKHDSQEAMKLISSDGLILWHDYAEHAPGVVRALEELAESHPIRRIEGTSIAALLAADMTR